MFFIQEGEEKRASSSSLYNQKCLKLGFSLLEALKVIINNTLFFLGPFHFILEIIESRWSGPCNNCLEKGSSIHHLLSFNTPLLTLTAFQYIKKSNVKAFLFFYVKCNSLVYSQCNFSFNAFSSSAFQKFMCVIASEIYW